MELSKTLITGGTGFIGYHLLNKLEKSGNDIIVLTRKEKYDTRIKYLQCNLLHPPEKMYENLKDILCVIHIAALMPQTSIANDKKTEYIENNLLTTINLLNLLPDTTTKFIYISSIDVYGEPTYLPIDENHPTNPVSYYAASKLAAEKFIEIFCQQNNITLTILRPSQVYGPGEPVIKAIPNFIQSITKDILPTIFGDGSDERDYVFVEDVVDAIIYSMENTVSGIYNIASGESISLNEVVTMLISISGKKLNPLYLERTNKCIKIKIDISKARKFLLYSPKTSLFEGLQKQFLYVKEKK